MTTLAATHAVMRAIGGGLARGRGRAAVAILAIASGVALGYAVEIVNRSAVNSLVSGLATLSGKGDLEIRGPGAGFDENVYPRLFQDLDVADASPVLEVDAAVAGHRRPLTIYGVDVFRTAAMTPALAPIGRDREDALRGDALFPSAAAAQWLGVRAGDRIGVYAAGREITLRVAGTAGIGPVAAGGATPPDDATPAGRAPPREGSAPRYAVMDIAAVQRDFARLGRITRVDVRLRAGADPAVVAKRLEGWLPAGVAATPPEVARNATAEASRAYRVNLDVLALVALVTGAMLVFATQTLSLVRRRQTLALMRTLGLARRRLAALVVAESAWLGLAGSIAGLALGYAIADVTLRHFGPDLGGGFFREDPVSLAVDLVPALAMGSIGIAAAVLGGIVPALEAASTPPAQALRAADPDLRHGGANRDARAKLVASACVAAALGAAFLPAIGSLPIAGYASIALLLAAAIVAMPSIAKFALSALPAMGAIEFTLACAHLRAAPGRAAVSLAAMVTSVALMVSMAIMVTSFRDSFQSWLSTMLPADLYVRAGPSETGVLTAAAQGRLRAVHGVARVEFSRRTSILLDPAKPPVALLARDVDPRNPGARLAIEGQTARGSPSAPPVWVSEVLASERGLVPGNVIELPLAGARTSFTVAGVWRDYARPQGAIVIERARYEALTGDASVNEAAFWLDDGAVAAAVQRAVERVLGNPVGITVISAGDLRRRSLSVFDRTFAVTYALEAVAVAIGLVALSASLVAQTIARRREFGVLRHLGMTRRQVARMLAIEGAATGAIGTVIGLLLGLAISLVLIEVVNRQSFHWTIDFEFPWAGMGLLAVSLVLLSALTGYASSRSATRDDAVRAVREDW